VYSVYNLRGKGTTIHHLTSLTLDFYVWDRSSMKLQKNDNIYDYIDMACCICQRIEDFDNKIDRLAEIGQECRALSGETIDICRETQDQHNAMIKFSSEIQSTLEGSIGTGNKAAFQNGAHILTVIKEMTSGDRVQAAMGIAKGLTDVATKCVDRSIRLTALTDKGLEEMPKLIKKAIQGGTIKADKDGNDATSLQRGLDDDFNEVQKSLDDIEHLSLTNALKVGMDAFVLLNSKSKRCQDLFNTMQTFASDVNVVSKALDKEQDADEGNPFQVMSRTARSVLRIVRSTSLMKMIAEGIGKLLNLITRLFEAASGKISKLWAAFSDAKDCLLKCLQPVQDAIKLCTKSKETSLRLIEKSQIVSRQLDAANGFDFQALFKLIKDGEIQETIDLATSIDDEIIEATNKCVEMVDNVNDGYRNLPDILTSGIDPVEAGRCIDDPDVPDLDDDLLEFETTTRSLEGTDTMNTSKSAVRGFTDVSVKTEKCIQMITSFENFAMRCQQTIESFINEWNLESATTKVIDMCRLITTGELMKRFADKINCLLKAMIAYMKSAFGKFTGLQKFGKLLPGGKSSSPSGKNGKKQEKITNIVGSITDTFKIF
jgi:hypothetical protein